jgi:hypothetical protein
VKGLFSQENIRCNSQPLTVYGSIEVCGCPDWRYFHRPRRNLSGRRPVYRFSGRNAASTDYRIFIPALGLGLSRSRLASTFCVTVGASKNREHPLLADRSIRLMLVIDR